MGALSAAGLTQRCRPGVQITRTGTAEIAERRGPAWAAWENDLMGTARGPSARLRAGGSPPARSPLPNPLSAPMSRRSLLALAAAGALASACSSSGPDNAATYSFPRDGVFYGAATPPDQLAAFEAKLGSPLSCYRSFFGSEDVGGLHSRVADDLWHGRMPIASIKPPGAWAQAAGDHEWIESLVGPLGDLRRRLFLCVHHEPENDADHYGTPADYVAMQNAVIDAAKATPSVVVTPILGSWSFDERSGRVPSEWKVDRAAVYGVDIYNPWSVANGKDWVPFSDKLALAHDEADGRPLVIGEYGCRSDPAQPGRAAQWLDDAFSAAIDADVVAMAYFNSSLNAPDGTWELDHETFPAFAQLLGSPDVAWLRP
jgi:hypothetical protein